MARAAKAAHGLDRVILIPAARPPHKPTSQDMASPHDRLTMTRAAAEASGEDFDVSDIELARLGPSYTIDTVRELARLHPGDSFFFIIGADTVGELPTWREAARLLEEVRVVVVNRPGYDLERGLATVAKALGESAAQGLRERIVEMPPQPVSSTEVRRLIRDKVPGWQAHVPAGVASIIESERLYGRDFVTTIATVDKLVQHAGQRVELRGWLYKQRGKVVNKFQFFAVPIQKRDETAISIATYHPQNGGPYPTPDKANREWSHAFTAADGDIVDGLQARIRLEQTKIARGEDIRCEFSLHFHPAAKTAGPFAQPSTSAFVWDGKYSNGYRNHSFLVEFPDGSSKIFRREEVGDWSKNAPHPVEVSEKKPYVLPEWFEGKTFKSLKEIGLETKLPGKYVVTGLYSENSGQPEPLQRRGAKMWGGNIASTPVVIEVT